MAFLKGGHIPPLNFDFFAWEPQPAVQIKGHRDLDPPRGYLHDQFGCLSFFTFGCRFHKPFFVRVHRDKNSCADANGRKLIWLHQLIGFRQAYSHLCRQFLYTNRGFFHWITSFQAIKKPIRTGAIRIGFNMKLWAAVFIAQYNNTIWWSFCLFHLFRFCDASSYGIFGHYNYITLWLLHLVAFVASFNMLSILHYNYIIF